MNFYREAPRGGLIAVDIRLNAEAERHAKTAVGGVAVGVVAVAVAADNAEGRGG